MNHHHQHMVADFRTRFIISTLVTVPVLALSPMIQNFLNFSLDIPKAPLILMALSSFIYFYGGWPFLAGSWREIKSRRPGMMTLVAVAISVAYFYSSAVVFGVSGKFFFWELVTLIDIMLLGHWIEMRSLMGASKALEELAKLMPSEAHLVKEDGSIEDVTLSDLKKEDRVLVRPGEKIPVDGKVVDGSSEVNEALITGETAPVLKEVDTEVIGGSINGSGSITVVVTKTGKETYLSQIIDLVQKAAKSKSSAQALADRAALILTIIALSVGLLTLAVWVWLQAEFVFALERSVTVMVVTCPHALGLAIPLVISVITALSAKNGILIRNRTPFENAYNIDTVVFDKTGTLTKGEFGVSDVVSLGSWSEEELLSKAASVERKSEHSIASSIVKYAKEKNIDLSPVENFKSIAGKGASAIINGESLWIGNVALVEDQGLSTADIKEFQPLTEEGKTVVFVLHNDKIQGLIALSDIIRDESKEAVSALRDDGIQVTMITGDNSRAAKHIAKKLGLDDFFAEVLPDQKADKIKELQNQGKKVAMVGDGINDAPALTQADVGIGIGAGTDVAIESADIVLVENNPKAVVDLISLSRTTRRKTLQNLAWATGYNVVAIPLAAGVLYHWGVIMPPAAGAVIMSLSTIIVAINAKTITFAKRS